MGHAALALLEENGYKTQDCLGAGVGSPGTIDGKSGTVLYSNNIRWDHVPLAAELSKYLPMRSLGTSALLQKEESAHAAEKTAWKLTRRHRH